MTNKLKIVANLTKNTNGVLAFKTDSYTAPLKVGTRYNIEFKVYKSSRSLEQNRMMWAIIQDIAKETGNDEMDVYIVGLEHVNAKSDFILALPETEINLRKAYRAVKIMESREYNNKQMYVYKCYIGSSKFDTSEMTKLIDYFIGQAEELDLNTQIWS